VSIGVRTGAVHTMAPPQWALPTVIIADVRIGAGVFAIFKSRSGLTPGRCAYVTPARKKST
jgi:hypothetical protein